MAYSKQTWDTTSYVNPTRMNHIEDGIATADLTSGGTIVGNLTVNAQNGTTSAEGRSRLLVGNDIASGTDGNSYGMLTLYAKNTRHINISAVDSPTDSRNIYLPDKNGTLALKEWTLLGSVTSGGSGIDVNNYSELYIVPKMQGWAAQNPFTFVIFAHNINVYYGIMVNANYGVEFIINVSSTGVFTIGSETLKGWTSCTYDIYGK